MNFGTTEIIIIAFIVLILFGAKRLPGLAKSIGSSITMFKKGINEGEEDSPAKDEPKG